LSEIFDQGCHFQAIWGGPVVFSAKYSHLMKGANRANSVNFAPQKLLSVTLQCSFILVRDKEEAGKTLSASSADYLFGKNKCYDVAYDIGDKKFQCGAKVDSFKLWLMFKARGMRDIESAIDNSIDCAKYLVEELKKRDDFRPVIQEFEFSNACFWYIPKHLRGKQENEAWWQEVYEVVPRIKARLLLDAKATTTFSVLKQRNIGSFFRISLMSFPRHTQADMDFIIREIARVGEEICS
jgi:glutamate/tyrosine decarboxylase-like PLP-dependent enzyme